MPVEFEQYPDDGDRDWTLREGSNAHTILSFLAERPDHGFTPKEIHDATGIPRGSVGPTLARLADRRLVRHKGEYWAIAEDDRIGAYAGALHSMDAISDQFAGDYYDRNRDWADDIPDLDAETDTDADEENE